MLAANAVHSTATAVPSPPSREAPPPLTAAEQSAILDHAGGVAAATAVLLATLANDSDDTHTLRTAAAWLEGQLSAAAENLRAYELDTAPRFRTEHGAAEMVAAVGRLRERAAALDIATERHRGAQA